MAAVAPFHPSLSEPSLEDEITALAAHIDAAQFRFLELIRAFDLAEGWAGDGIRSCAHWLQWRCGIGLGAAREKLRVAHALARLPKISARFREGRLSYSMVRAMTRVATPASEDYLLMIAEHGTVAHMERLVRGYRRVKRLEDENERHAQRSVSWYQDDDGSWVLHGRFTPEQAAVIGKALEVAFDETGASEERVSAETPLHEMAEPVAARRADALVRMAEGFLASEADRSGGDRCLIHLHTDMDTLRADGEGMEAQLEGHGEVAAESARRLGCDCSVVQWLECDGEPLSVGRKTRSIPPAIRRALWRRDGGCRFPGCGARRFVDAHHIVHWADGGETSLDNLVLLCGQHHRLVHEGGFGVPRAADGEIWFEKPGGELIPPAPMHDAEGDVRMLVALNGDCGLEIDADSLASRWDGSRMDDWMAVDGLLAFDSPRFS